MAHAFHYYDEDSYGLNSENITTSWELFGVIANRFLTEATDFTGDDEQTQVTYTGTTTKKFLVSAQISLSSSLVSRLVTMQIRVDGTAAADTTVGAWLDEANREKSVSLSCIVEVAQNETVGVYFYNSGSSSIAVQRFQLTCVEVS